MENSYKELYDHAYVLGIKIQFEYKTIPIIITFENKEMLFDDAVIGISDMDAFRNRLPFENLRSLVEDLDEQEVRSWNREIEATIPCNENITEEEWSMELVVLGKEDVAKGLGKDLGECIFETFRKYKEE